MRKLIFLTALMLQSLALFAKDQYQVDLIVFAQPGADISRTALKIEAPLPPIPSQAKTLSSSPSNYHLLAPAQSQLKDALYQLGRRREYTVLAQYTWTQPTANKTVVALPLKSAHGWSTQGTILIKNGAYYSLNTDLQITSPNSPNGYFKIEQNQRIKPNTVYYFDHPMIGLLVSIHK